MPFCVPRADGNHIKNPTAVLIPKKIESNCRIETPKKIHINYYLTRIGLKIHNFCRYFCLFLLFRRKSHLKV